MRNGHNQTAANGDHKAGTLNDGTASTIRCVLVGDACVGKTALIVAYTRNGFSDRYVPTAFDNYSVTVNVDGKPLKFELSDTAGRSEFDTIRPLSYADANIFLLCFSVMKPESLKSVTERWLPELRALNSTAPVVLVGTQSDLRFGRLNGQVGAPTDFATLTRIASQYQAEYIECSAVTQLNLKEVFDLAILYGLNQRSAPKSRNPSTTLRNSLTTSKNKTNSAAKASKIPTKSDATHKMVNGLNGTTNGFPNEASTVAGVLKTAGQVSRYNNGNAINGSAKVINKGAAVVDRNCTENKFPAKSYNNVHNGNGLISNKTTHNAFNSVNPYGGWLTPNDNYLHHRPTYKAQSRNSGATCGAAYDTHSKPVIPQATTTIKDGFRKLISMTRRFL